MSSAIIPLWLLIAGEFFWPVIGIYVGCKYHPALGVLLAVIGFIISQGFIYYAFENSLVN